MVSELHKAGPLNPVARGQHVALGTVLCCQRHSFMLPAAQCYVASGTVLCCQRHSVMLPAETFQMRKRLSTLSLVKPR
jgi:hypothetical protein